MTRCISLKPTRALLRTVPFICKAYDEPYVNYATKVMLGNKKIKDFTFNPTKKGYAIKVRYSPLVSSLK